MAQKGGRTIRLSYILQAIMAQLNGKRIYLSYKELLHVLYELGYKDLENFSAKLGDHEITNIANIVSEHIKNLHY